MTFTAESNGTLEAPSSSEALLRIALLVGLGDKVGTRSISGSSASESDELQGEMDVERFLGEEVLRIPLRAVLVGEADDLDWAEVAVVVEQGKEE